MTDTTQSPDNKEKQQAEQQTETIATEEVRTPEQEAQETAVADETTQEQDTEQSLKAKLMEAKAKLAAIEKKAQDNWEALVRQKAEYENLQKRTERDIENARKFALERFASELLPVRDNLELGIEAASKPDTQIETVIEGMNLTDKVLIDVLNKFGIEEINPQKQKFNPEWHEAIAMQPIPDVEDNTVVIVHRKGYHLNERLLRAAQVVVAKQS